MLRPPRLRDFEEWADLREESRSFLTPWEPLWPEDDLTRHSFRRRLRRYEDDIRNDSSYPFFVFRQVDELLIGGLTLSLVHRGAAQSCKLGYWIGERHARQGYMSRAVKLVKIFAFGELAMHRIEAACLPTNAASIRLLEKSGFTREGYARQYLRIAGAWEDHLLYAMLRADHAA